MQIALLFILSLAMITVCFSKSMMAFVMSAALIVSLAVILTQRKQIFSKERFVQFIQAKEVIAISFLLGVWLISCLNGINVDRSVEKWGQIAAICIGAGLIFLALACEPIDFSIFINCIAGLTVLMAIILAIGIMSGHLDYGWSARYGIVLAVPIPFVMTSIFSQKSLFSWRQFLLLLGLLIVIAIVFTSGARTSLLVIFVTCCLFPLVFTILQRKWTFLIVPALFMIAAYLGLEGHSTIVGDSVVDNKIQGMVSGERIASGRIDLWQYIINNLNLTSFFGNGIETFDKLGVGVSSTGTPYAHPHNAILELLLDTGLVGFGAFCGVIGIIFIPFARITYQANKARLQERVFANGLVLMAFSYGLCSMSHTSLFKTWWFLYLVLILIIMKATEVHLRAKLTNSLQSV